jgi:transposase
MFQKESALTLWYRAHTADSRIGTREAMIVALARKLIIALWRFVTTGDPLDALLLLPHGVRVDRRRGELSMSVRAA